MSWIVAALLALSCLGWGALALRLCRIDDQLPWRERAAWAFALGLGVVGWLGFATALAGGVGPADLAMIVSFGLPGLMTLGPPPPAEGRPGRWSLVLLALLALVLAGDLIEALAPPSDADSLAYHFAIPRQILREGRLVFIARAVDGAVPLLPQMTYMVALGLGGEQAMTLWCMLSGWAAPALTYALARRHLERDWSLAAALAVASLPAVLYGAGSGQVETRLALFTTVAVLAAVAAREKDGPAATGWAAAAGLAAGFAMGSKYPGLLVAFLCGALVLAQRRGPRLAAVFSLAALAAGGQWYGWNWWNTGDPVFPVLYGVVPYHPGTPWTPEQDALFRRWSSAIEAPLPRGLTDLLLYPLMVTFYPPEAVDGGRTGLGAVPVLLAPFAAAAAWRHRRSPAVRPWLLAALVVAGFHLVWFAFGASQRVRHYLPFMPLIVVGLLAAAERGTAGAARRALAAGLAALLLVQVAGQAVYVRNFALRLIRDESREAFLGRNVAFAFAVDWANAGLPAEARVLVPIRQWLYLLDRRYLFVHPVAQAEVIAREDARDERLFWRQLRAAGITHALLPEIDPDTMLPPGGSPDEGGLYGLMARTAAAGCAQPLRVLEGPRPVMSRTLEGGGQGAGGGARVVVVAFTPAGCRLG